MDSLKRKNHADELARVEHLVTQFFSKSLHLILQSRCVCSHIHTNATENSRAQVTTRDRWFNLALPYCRCPLPIHSAGMQYSRQMVVDVVLLQQPSTVDGCLCGETKASSGRNDCFGDAEAGKVIERWVVVYEGKKKGRDDASLKSSTRIQGFYKKCIVMLRSLLLMLKLLPAYKVYRELTALHKPCKVSLVHYVSSFAIPFAREMEAEMRRYVFEPVESFSGRLCLSVMHLPALKDLRIRPPINQMLCHLVTDYFGADSFHPVSGALLLPDNGKVIAGTGSKASRSDTKPPLIPESELHLATQAHLPTTLIINSSTRETSVDCVKIENAAKCQWCLALPASISPSPHARMSICPPHCLSQTKVDKCQNPEESGDPLPAKLSDNAVLGSLVSAFQNAAPLRLSSTIRSNTANVPATAEIPTSRPLVKTALDAFKELRVYIDVKNTILEKSCTLKKSDK